MMKSWLIFSFIVGSYAFFDALNTRFGESQTSNLKLIKSVERKIKNEIDAAFANFTNLFQDGHPSTAIPLKAVTTCIEQKGLVEPIKEFLVQIAMFQIKNSTFEEKKTFCRKNTEPYSDVAKCISSSIRNILPDDWKSETFFHALDAALEYSSNVACLENPKTLFFDKSEVLELLQDFPKYANFIKRDEYLHSKMQKPEEKDSCLPVRVAEAYEIAAIKSRRIPLFFHVKFALANQIFTTLRGKYPFMMIEECA
uniref:Uncharacterized protein n=1 Tax=Panagrolaimus davidi TaxID=227884 RepID=A0A914QWY8_9BILA